MCLKVGKRTFSLHFFLHSTTRFLYSILFKCFHFTASYIKQSTDHVCHIFFYFEALSTFMVFMLRRLSPCRCKDWLLSFSKNLLFKVLKMIFLSTVSSYFAQLYIHKSPSIWSTLNPIARYSLSQTYLHDHEKYYFHSKDAFFRFKK